jgi:hypothetical protein
MTEMKVDETKEMTDKVTFLTPEMRLSKTRFDEWILSSD